MKIQSKLATLISVAGLLLTTQMAYATVNSTAEEFPTWTGSGSYDEVVVEKLGAEKNNQLDKTDIQN